MSVRERIIFTDPVAVSWPAGQPMAVHPPSSREQARLSTSESWGWLPALSPVTGLGLLMVSLAYSTGRGSVVWAEQAFWAGLLVLTTPILLRLVFASTSRRESIGLLSMLGLSLFLVKVMHSPLAFTFHDEFAHWRTSMDILQSGRLFHENPLIPISARYPGLEIVTAALASQTDLSIFSAGVLVLGVARIILILALYLFYERISGSSRPAALATFVYMANPNFLFFDAQYSYESLALPFAVLMLFTMLRREDSRTTAERIGFTTALILALAALVITHHLAAFGFIMLMVLWACIDLLRRRPATPMGPRGIALLAVVICVTWLVYVAMLAIDYVRPHLIGALFEMTRLILLEHAGRQLFRSTVGLVAPPIEQLTALASVGLVLLGLVFGLPRVWRYHRGSPIVLTLALTTLAYPVSLAFRLTERGWEAANRSSEFLFLGLGLVLSLAVIRFREPARMRRLRAFAITGAGTVIFLGGIIMGWPPVWRVPGPYLVAADTRSIEPQGLLAAQWALAYLGPDNRMASDRTNNLLMGSIGHQAVVTTLNGGVDTSWVFFAPRVGKDQIELLREGRIRYLVVDRRLSAALPWAGYYYEPGDQKVFKYTEPIDPDLLAKFDTVPNVNRIFDSGDIIIYDIGAVSGVQ